MSPEKLDSFTDPAYMIHEGVDRIKWVQFDGGVAFARNSGKLVSKYDYYRKSDANSSTAAGFLMLAAVGVTDSHPSAVTSGMFLPVNMGDDITGVMPTSNRAAVEVDRGQTFDVLVDSDGRQFVDLNSTAGGLVQLDEILDDDGEVVSVRIPEATRWGNL